MFKKKERSTVSPSKQTYEHAKNLESKIRILEARIESMTNYCKRGEICLGFRLRPFGSLEPINHLLGEELTVNSLIEPVIKKKRQELDKLKREFEELFKGG